ncbi:proteasome adapter and scaffold protein ECM29-like [Corticium candelabrum]|uniref:proteasome adapter and scaffold protein ECM29-like n=1 Tax=Corticium candelabrum TaxID=121492 RepID=UPI002E259BC7|nr:proteasome adapter and scaffold protein ECM29-like [Corticium candelabrum]
MAEELVLLERVFLRLTAAETDEKLQQVLGRFLAPVLLKLASQNEAVKKRVMEILAHINKRLKSRPQVQLPVEQLLQQYEDQNNSPFGNFSILYLKMGYQRLSEGKQADLAPRLLGCIEKKPAQQQDILLRLVCPVLGNISWLSSSEKTRPSFTFDEERKAKHATLTFCRNLLLMPYNLSPQRRPMSAPASSGSVSAGVDRAESGDIAPPGLSLNAVKQVTGDSAIKPNELEKAKLSVLTFLSSGLFQEAEVVLYFLIASADSRRTVGDIGESNFKKASSFLDWNDSQMAGVIQSIYQLFIGNLKSPQRPQTATGAKSLTADHHAPAGIGLRIQLLPVLLKSSLSPDMFPLCIQVIFESLFGEGINEKLRFLASQFLVHVIQHCSERKIEMMAPLLLSAINKLLDEPEQGTKLRCLTYVGLGQLAKRMSSLFSSNVALVQRLFDSLIKEQGDVRQAVHESLTTLSTAFKSASGLVLVQLEALLHSQLSQPNETVIQARLASLTYAGTIFSRSHAESRYLCLLASTDVVDSVQDEAKRILGVDEDKSPVEMPSFPEMVNCVASHAEQRLSSKLQYSAGASSLPFHPAVFRQMLLYLKRCFHCSAEVTNEDQFKRTITKKLCRYTASLRAPIQISSNESDSMMKYYDLIRLALSQIAGSELQAVALKCLFELVSVSPFLVSTVANQTGWLKQTFVESSHDEIRDTAAKLVGCVAQKLNDTQLLGLVSQTITALESKSFETQHGAVVLLGRLIPACVGGSNARLSGNTFQFAFTSLAKLLSAQQPRLIAAACKAVGLIGVRCVFPIEDGQEDDKERPAEADKKRRKSRDGCQVTKLDIVNTLVSHLHHHPDQRVREKAATALGLLPLGEKPFPHVKIVLKGLFESSKDKQRSELQFVVADAIACTSSCSASHILDTSEVAESISDGFASQLSQDTMTWSLDQIRYQYVNHSRSHVRQTVCVWLFAIVKTSGDHPIVKERLQELQALLLNYLADRDEFTQEVASRALGLVYERGSNDDKQQLVSHLVETLMSGRRSSQPVTGDTHLFGEGEIGRASEGSGLSTYKELCSLATDLNQPDLIYKFMRLANHNALWMSKRGAAFGFSTIAAQAREQLAPHLSVLVPRLFRYRYDPNPAIQQAMLSIWTALVPESHKEVDKYFSAILEDLLRNLASNLWRIRQSCCHALSDLLQGRQLDGCISQLPKMWELVFRARDDIKESVRKAADTACWTLSKVSVKLCDVSSGKSGQAAVALLLPFHLDKLVTSKVSEIRVISLLTLLEISKTAGSQLKPHIPMMVVVLLETLSSLEDKILNRISLHVGSNAEEQEKLDSIRVSASKSSPMMATVDLCMRHVDTDVLPELCIKLAEVTRNGIGVATKVGCCRVISSLTHQCTRDITPYAGKLLSALLSCLNDQSPGVRKAAATSVGHLVKFAKDSSIEKLIGRIKTWYLEKDDTNIRLACGWVFQSFAQHSMDTLMNFSAQILPIAFLAMHQRNENENTDIWSEVWDDATPGTEGGLRLYLDDILSLVCPLLESQSWQTKSQAARAMETVAEKFGGKLGNVQRESMLNSLVKSLPGRTWDGKERLMLAVSQLCQIGKEQSLSLNTLDKVVSVLLTECKKQKMEYKLVAFESVSRVLESNNLNRFVEFSSLCFPLLNPDRIEDVEIDEKPEERASTREMTLKLQESLLKCIARVWPQDDKTQVEYERQLFTMLMKLLAKSTWKIKVAVLDCLRAFLERLCLETVATSERCQEISLELIPLITTCLDNLKYSAVRGAAIGVLETFLARLMRNPEYCGRCLTGTEWRVLLRHMEEISKSDPQIALRQRTAKLLLDAIKYR